MTQDLSLTFVKVVPHKANYFESIIYDCTKGQVIDHKVYFKNALGEVFKVSAKDYTTPDKVVVNLTYNNDQLVYTKNANRYRLPEVEFKKGAKALSGLEIG